MLIKFPFSSFVHAQINYDQRIYIWLIGCTIYSNSIEMVIHNPFEPPFITSLKAKCNIINDEQRAREKFVYTPSAHMRIISDIIGENRRESVHRHLVASKLLLPFSNVGGSIEEQVSKWTHSDMSNSYYMLYHLKVLNDSEIIFIKIRYVDLFDRHAIA